MDLPPPHSPYTGPASRTFPCPPHSIVGPHSPASRYPACTSRTSPDRPPYSSSLPHTGSTSSAPPTSSPARSLAGPSPPPLPCSSQASHQNTRRTAEPHTYYCPCTPPSPASALPPRKSKTPT